MLDKQIQKLNSFSSLSTQLWSDLAANVKGLDNAPTNINLKASNWSGIDEFELPIEIYFYYTDISADRKRLMYCYNFLEPETFDEITCIAIYQIKPDTLTLETEFKFTNLDIEFETEHESEISNFRQAQFMGNDHIAMALATGRLRILSIPENTIFLDEKIAGLVSTLSCSENYLAVSLFPGIKEKYYYACGVKIYNIKDIIENKRLEACHVLSNDSFSILPHSLRLSSDDDRLLCKGSRILPKGYVNYIEEYSLKNKKLTTILAQEDENISQRISNYSSAGEYCVVSKEGLVVNNSQHKEIWRPELPEVLIKEKVKNCKLSPDGSQIIIFKKGVLYLVQKEKKKVTILDSLGYVTWAHFISKGQIIVGLGKFYYMEMVLINLKNFSIHARLNPDIPMEIINPDGYTFSGKGDLLISDSSGAIRKFSSDLKPQNDICHGYGPVRQLKYDPVPGNNVILSESGAIIIFDPDTGRMRLKIGKSCGKEITPGSDYQYIHTSNYNQTKLDGIWMCKSIYTRSIEFSDYRYLEMKQNSSSIEFSDWVDKAFKDDAQLQLPAKIVDTCDLNNQACILLKNGSIITVNPHQKAPSTGLMYSVIMENINSPRGLTRISNNKIVVWTKNSLKLIEKDEHGGRLLKSIKKTGIKNIKWDKQNNRLAVAFRTYISFYSKELTEMYRLYLIKDQGYIIHVPFPEQLKSDKTDNHPGYYWSSQNCTDLFEVTSEKKCVVKDQKVKEDFLSIHMNKFMVESALKDYNQFIRISCSSLMTESSTFESLLLNYDKSK